MEQPREPVFYPNEMEFNIGASDKAEKTLQSIDHTLKRIEAILRQLKQNQCSSKKEVKNMEIRSLEIDFDREILRINGEEVKGHPVLVTLREPEELVPHVKVYNYELATGRKGELDRLTVTYEKGSVNSKP